MSFANCTRFEAMSKPKESCSSATRYAAEKHDLPQNNHNTEQWRAARQRRNPRSSLAVSVRGRFGFMFGAGRAGLAMVDFRLWRFRMYGFEVRGDERG